MLDLVYKDSYFAIRRLTDNYIDIVVRRDRDEITELGLDVFYKPEEVVFSISESGVLLIASKTTTWEKFLNGDLKRKIAFQKYVVNSGIDYKTYKFLFEKRIEEIFTNKSKEEFIGDLIEKQNNIFLKFFIDYKLNEKYSENVNRYYKGKLKKDIMLSRSNFDIDTNDDPDILNSEDDE